MKFILTILSAVNQKLKMLYRDLRYSNTFRRDKATLSARLLIDGHVLEKGITMPERRLGFGYEKVRNLIANCNLYMTSYGEDNIELQAAIADLKQYLTIHLNENYELPQDIKMGIETLISKSEIRDENCYSLTKKDYFKSSRDYYDFANQRKSIRNFSNEDVSEETLLKAVELAQTAPSACNRQSVRVKIISDKGKMEIIHNEIQKGNRGFGHLANKWILITSELGAWSQSQVSMAYIDGGIFTMSLLNALHYYGICACTLNAHLSSSKLKRLQSVLQLPKSEVPIVFIAVGKPKEEFMVAKSRRKNSNDIVTIIK